MLQQQVRLMTSLLLWFDFFAAAFVILTSHLTSQPQTILLFCAAPSLSVTTLSPPSNTSPAPSVWSIQFSFFHRKKSISHISTLTKHDEKRWFFPFTNTVCHCLIVNLNFFSLGSSWTFHDNTICYTWLLLMNNYHRWTNASVFIVWAFFELNRRPQLQKTSRWNSLTVNTNVGTKH